MRLPELKVLWTELLSWAVILRVHCGEISTALRLFSLATLWRGGNCRRHQP